MNIRERISAALAGAKPAVESPIERFEAFTPEAKAGYPVAPTRLVVRDLTNVDAEAAAVCAVVGNWLRELAAEVDKHTMCMESEPFRGAADEIDPPKEGK